MMLSDKKPERFDAERVLNTCDTFREELWPLWRMERRLTAYYNGEHIPTDNDECDDDPVSLGLGHRFIKKPYDTLMDAILTEPGFIQTDLRYPLRAQHKSKIQTALDQEINAIVHDRMESTFRKTAGRAIILGRAFLYRLSKWDWQFKNGRMLHALDDCDDVYDEDFREWAFAGRLTLRCIDEWLESTRDYDGAGWNYKGLADLKKYILESTATEKDSSRTTRIDEMMGRPFDAATSRQPLDVYWYFRKNGEHAPDGHEYIDLYCVSRYGQTANIAVTKQGGIEFRALEVSGSDKPGNQVIYYLPNAFSSINECLIPIILDGRVDGDQTMAQVDGTGKIMVPRLLTMENIALSTAEGIAFGMQPNWQASGSMSTDDARKLAREGLGPWDVVPQGLQTMNKNNALTGMNAAMQMLQMLGVSAEQDAATGEISPMGPMDPKFKALAVQMVQQTQAAVTRRQSSFFKKLDLLAEQQVETLCRPLTQWRKGDAGYYDVETVQVNMAIKHGILPAEYSSERMSAKCRRLQSGGDRQQTITTSVSMAQMFGGQLGPEGLRFLAKEACRAAYGDVVTDQVLMPDNPEQQPDQIATAQAQNAQALLSLTQPQRGPKDNPAVHIPVHMTALQANFQAAQQQGSITPAQKMGLGSLMMHTAQDLQGAPQQAQEQIGGLLQKAAKMLATMPVTGAGTKQALAEHAEQRKDADFKLKTERESNLQKDREAKQDLKQKHLMLEMQKYLETEKNNGSQRAATLINMMGQIHEMNTPDPAAEGSLPAGEAPEQATEPAPEPVAA